MKTSDKKYTFIFELISKLGPNYEIKEEIERLDTKAGSIEYRRRVARIRQGLKSHQVLKVSRLEKRKFEEFKGVKNVSKR